MGGLSHCAMHLHNASEIGLDGVERRLTRGPILTIAQGVELLLRVGKRPTCCSHWREDPTGGPRR
jgi:hypothetical protein